jgi:IS1 family transposase
MNDFMKHLPNSMIAVIENERKSWNSNNARSAFFKKYFGEKLYGENSKFNELKTKENQRNRYRWNAFESCVETYMAHKLMGERSMKLVEVADPKNKGQMKHLIIPTTESINTTADITNWAYLQLPLLNKIYFNNTFAQLISSQPARSRTGTFFKTDILRGDTGIPTSIYSKDDFDVTYGDYTENGSVHSLNFKMSTDTFTTTERALSAEVTDMLQQDLSAEHGLDAFNELMPMVSTELAKIESVLLLTALMTQESSMATTSTWNYYPAKTDDINSTFGTKSYHQTLLDEINTNAREIKKATGVEATWVYMDVDTWGIIENSLNTVFKEANKDILMSKTAVSNAYNTGENTSAQYKGVLGGKYDVFVDNSGMGSTGKPINNKIIIGATSMNWTYQGMTYLPFILGWSPSRLRSYDKIFNQKQGVLNRSGYKVNNPLFYATVTITRVVPS